MEAPFGLEEHGTQFDDDYLWSGLVNNNDVTILNGFYNPERNPSGPEGPRHWFQADFNYDGRVDNLDVSILNGFYDPDAPPLESSVKSAPLTAVPEPSLGCLATVLAAIARTRRRLVV